MQSWYSNVAGVSDCLCVHSHMLQVCASFVWNHQISLGHLITCDVFLWSRRTKNGELLALVPPLLIREFQQTRCYPVSCHSAVAIRPIHLDLRDDFSEAWNGMDDSPLQMWTWMALKHLHNPPSPLRSHLDLVLTRDGWIHPDQSFQDLGSGLAKLLAWSEGASRIFRRSSYTEPPLTLCRYSQCPRRTARARSWWKKQLKHFRNQSCWSNFSPPYI